MDFISYPTSFQRVPTREVRIGHLRIGAGHPVLPQSMLVASALEQERAFLEIQALVQADCPLIRLTIPSQKELDAASRLIERVREEGIKTPLVADIHFTPQLALQACEFFEKIRINPGNYTDSPKASKGKNEAQAYEEGRLRLQEELKPLALMLRKYGRALRIGVNQGSLSQRVMERFGDSPLGMVESALESAQILEAEGFTNSVISLKSSNPMVVQKAYRLLVERQNGLCYPMHLGVTEAGEGEMARIKSLAGIATLLRDGIGDTIRVSLTEPSVQEIPYAKLLIEGSQQEAGQPSPPWKRPLEHRRMERQVYPCGFFSLGGGQLFRLGVEQGLVGQAALEPDFLLTLEKDHLKVGQQSWLILEKDNLKVLETISSAEPVVLSGLPDLFQFRAILSRIPKPLPPLGLLAEDLQGQVAKEAQAAAMLSEGLLDFVCLPKSLSEAQVSRWSQYLQATRQKSFTADYIACPSCGRTLFDLERVTKEIQGQTQHLKGVKIGIMGCIVNGPGEMADADFGYVGSGPGKVDLYFGQERVERGLDQSVALERLIQLIKEKGAWVEPKPL